MPRAKKAEAPASAETTIAKENANAAQRGTPIEEYALRVKAAQSPSLDPQLVKARVTDALERQGYEYEDIRKVVKSL